MTRGRPGIWGAVAGAAAGPIIGGLLVSTWSWRAVFCRPARDVS